MPFTCKVKVARCNVNISSLFSLLDVYALVKAQRFVKLSFVLITIAIASALVYTVNFHYGIYHAVRNLQLTIQQLEVNVLNQTQAPVSITLTLTNPSDYPFTVLAIDQALYLNDFNQFIVTLSGGRMKQIAAQSNIEVTLEASVPSRKIDLVKQPEEKTWLLYTIVTLRGPLIGTLRLRDISHFVG